MNITPVYYSKVIGVRRAINCRAVWVFVGVPECVIGLGDASRIGPKFGFLRKLVNITTGYYSKVIDVRRAINGRGFWGFLGGTELRSGVGKFFTNGWASRHGVLLCLFIPVVTFLTPLA